MPSQQVLQECGKRLAAFGSHCRNFHKLVCCTVRMFRVRHNRIAVRAVRMTVWREQLRMIERRRLRDCPRIRQAVAQEIHQVDFFLQR